MHVCAYVKSRFGRVQARVQSVVNRRLSKAKGRSIQISEPFGFKHIPIEIPGISNAEIIILREKAIASRFATVDRQLEKQHEHGTQQSQQPNKKPSKTRANSRTLTSTTATHGPLTLTASKPSITRSFASEDSLSRLSPSSTYAYSVSVTSSSSSYYSGSDEIVVMINGTKKNKAV